MSAVSGLEAHIGPGQERAGIRPELKAWQFCEIAVPDLMIAVAGLCAGHVQSLQSLKKRVYRPEGALGKVILGEMPRKQNVCPASRIYPGAALLPDREACKKNTSRIRRSPRLDFTAWRENFQTGRPPARWKPMENQNETLSVAECVPDRETIAVTPPLCTTFVPLHAAERGMVLETMVSATASFLVVDPGVGVPVGYQLNSRCRCHGMLPS